MTNAENVSRRTIEFLNRAETMDGERRHGGVTSRTSGQPAC